MLGSILGGAMQIGGAVANGIFGARSAAKQRKMINEQRDRNRAWYDRRYNEVGTERADARAALTAMRDAQTQRMANAAGRSAVMGGSSNQAAMERQAANNAIGNTISGINAGAESRKAGIENQYMQRDNKFADDLIKNEQQRQQSISSAVTTASDAAASMAKEF